MSLPDTRLTQVTKQGQKQGSIRQGTVLSKGVLVDLSEDAVRANARSRQRQRSSFDAGLCACAGLEPALSVSCHPGKNTKHNIPPPWVRPTGAPKAPRKAQRFLFARTLPLRFPQFFLSCSPKFQLSAALLCSIENSSGSNIMVLIKVFI